MTMYPGAIKTWVDKVDLTDFMTAGILNDDVMDEIIAVETELGTDPAGAYATVKARLDASAGGFSPVSVETKTANYAITTSDFNKSIRMNSAAIHTFTLPSVGAGDDGKRLTLMRMGAGVVCIAASDSDVIVSDDYEGASINCSQTDPEQASITLEYCHAETAWMSIATQGMWICSNYFGDGSDGAVQISADTSLNSTQDGDMLVKQYSSLTIDAAKTLTVDDRCKGLFVYVTGNCVINGTLSMIARGANVDPSAAGVSATGIRLAMLKSGETDTLTAADFAGCGAAVIAAVANQSAISGNGKIYTIARAGAAGGASQGAASTNGNNGAAGTAGQSGGGGSGAFGAGGSAPGGAGSQGTCFSGGTGGGGSRGVPTGGAANGGAGGYGDVAANGATCAAGGGAGNPGGAGDGTTGNSGETGTGGVLILIVGGNLTIGASGVISSNGKNGGAAAASSESVGGGASGGGNVLVLYAGSLSNSGTIEANAGSGGVGSGGSNVNVSGGNGGAGSVQGPTQVDV